MQKYKLECPKHKAEKTVWDEALEKRLCGMCRGELVSIKIEEESYGGDIVNNENINEQDTAKVIKEKKPRTVKEKTETDKIKDGIALKIVDLLNKENVDIKVKTAAISRAYQIIKGA